MRRLTRTTVSSVAMVLCAVAGEVDHAVAQGVTAEVIEIPLEVREGRLWVTAVDDAGNEHPFVVGLGMSLFTESIGGVLGEDGTLTVGGISVPTDQAQRVPDGYIEGAAGVLGGLTWNDYDLLLDVPNGRMLLKTVGRAVRWDGITLSNPVGLQVFHDVLLRAEVDFGGRVVGGLLDLSGPVLEANSPLAPSVESGVVSRFRVGYGSWSDLPATVTENPLFGGWDPSGDGFVIIGAPLTIDCAIAISWRHQELRTCVR